MEVMSSEKSKWCDLPEDILLQIVRRLNSTTDLPRLRGVCPEWRSAIPRSFLPNLSSSLKVPSLFNDNKLPLSLVQSRFYLLSPLPFAAASASASALGGRWLARMAETGPNNQWHLFNPFNLHDYYWCRPRLTASLNLLDCRALELAAPFSLFGGDGEVISKKVVGGWDFDSGYKFSVLVQLDSHGRGGGLVSWKLGETEWTFIQETYNDWVLDIAFYNGNFYAFELFGWRVQVMDASCPSKAVEFIPAPDILEPVVEEGGFTVTFDGLSYILASCHLVAADSRLYLLVEADENETDFTTIRVYVLKQEEEDEKQGQSRGSRYSWEHVDSLGDHIFFIGYDVAFALSASSVNLPQWKPNSICLFTNPFPLFFELCQRLDSLSVSLTCADYWRGLRLFNMAKGDEMGVVPFKELPNEVYTGLFFPPPAWVQCRCPSRNNVKVELAHLKFRGESDTDNVREFRIESLIPALKNIFARTFLDYELVFTCL